MNDYNKFININDINTLIGKSQKDANKILQELEKNNPFYLMALALSFSMLCNQNQKDPFNTLELAQQILEKNKNDN